MKASAFSVDGVFDALALQPARAEGRTIMLVSGRRGAGVTRVAHALAAAAGARQVYAIDLDLKRNALARSLANGNRLGPAQDGRIGGHTFYRIHGSGGRQLQEPTQAFTYHRVAGTRVLAGVFDARALPDGGRVAILSAPDYWDGVRASGAMAVVDAPSLDRSRIALRVARNMDGVALIVGDGAGDAPAALAAKEALAAAGANIIGLVYVGASSPVLVIERLLRQTG